jgi:lipopolysaccharide/colanic/teichoic acid biosynthesis glycosyltransferase
VEKRLFDVLVASVLLLTIYPWVRFRRLIADKTPSRPHVQTVLMLPRILLGEMSFVGRPLSDSIKNAQAAYLGPKGLTGLVQINQREDLEQEEIERYMVYYAKNQSLMLDLEIMVKSLLMRK